MGIYIKGMEMPTSCADCRVRLAVGCFGNLPHNTRMPNCPVGPVPAHGRLIDADALIDYVAEKYNAKKVGEQKAFEMADFVLFDIPDAPTIIPASEEGE